MKVKKYSKIILSGLFAVMLCLGIGCQHEKKDLGDKISSQKLTGEVLKKDSQISEEESRSKLTQKELKAFFDKYLSFTDEELMVLNQKRNMKSEYYWSNLKNFYFQLIEEKIGEYLEDELREQIKWGYREEEIELPKWMLINEYIVSGNGQVESVDIEAVRTNEEETIYEVQVISTHNITPVQSFLSQYSWNDEAGYFIEAVQEENRGNLLLQNDLLQEVARGQMEMQDYWLSETEDAMKLRQSFLLTVNNNTKGLKISRINTNVSWEEERGEQSLLATQHVTRLPYEECATKEEVQQLERLLTVIFGKGVQDYKYYESAYDNGYEIFQKVWEEWALEDVIALNEASYLMAFAKSISPYKDQVRKLEMDSSKINIQPSIYSTLKQPRFVVSIPVRALLYNNQIVYYKYEYFVGMEENKVEFIQFVSMKQMERLEEKDR